MLKICGKISYGEFLFLTEISVYSSPADCKLRKSVGRHASLSPNRGKHLTHRNTLHTIIRKKHLGHTLNYIGLIHTRFFKIEI